MNNFELWLDHIDTSSALPTVYRSEVVPYIERCFQQQPLVTSLVSILEICGLVGKWGDFSLAVDILRRFIPDTTIDIKLRAELIRGLSGMKDRLPLYWKYHANTLKNEVQQTKLYGSSVQEDNTYQVTKFRGIY